MLETIREHRIAALAWVVGGALANLAMVLSLAKELDDFPGGAEALARVLGPSVEAFRPLRWPAERLDTLGGYFTYHNATLITMFLAVYAVVQGARSVRILEERHSMELMLATGTSRRRLVAVRSVGFAILLAVIAAGIAAGTAVAFALAGEPDTGGAVVTFLAGWCAAVMCFGLAQLLSQFTKNARVAWGIGSTVLIGLYVLGNSAEELGPFEFVQVLSPFYYTNLSRAMVPGVEAHWLSMAGMVALGVAAIAASAWFLERRDLDAAYGARRRHGHRHVVRRRSRTVGSLWADGLVHGWVSIVAWAASAAGLTGLMIALEPAAMDAWEYFDVLLPEASGADVDRVAQYIALSASLMIPIIAGYVVAQSAKWTSDFTSGRVGLLLAAPVTWARVLATRVAITMLGTTVIAAASVATMTAVAAAVDVEVDWAGLGRLFVISLALGLAMSALAAIATVVFKSRGAVVVLALYLGAAYLLTFVVPMLGWPDWLNGLSVFHAFGNPYLEWPTLAESTVIIALAGPGLILAFILTARSRKVP
ncbi:ABC transporter permease subunit [Agromyces bauzanensis]